MDAQREDPTIQKLIRLGHQHEQIRAIILTSTRAAAGAAPDTFSDYDVQLFLCDTRAFLEDESWLDPFGTMLVLCRTHWDEEDGEHIHTRLALYEDGTKIDFSIWPIARLQHIAVERTLTGDLDAGYQVLLDKDGLAAQLPAPGYLVYRLQKPTESEYAHLVNGFWWNSTYVAKHLWRDDLLPARYMLDSSLKHYHLRTALEWSVGITKDWAWTPGLGGKGLKTALHAATYQELVDTYVGADTGELWEALFRTTALFRKTAIKVGDELGYAYLHDLDERVTIYLETVRRLDHTATRDDLARLLTQRYQARRK